MFYLYTR